MWPSDRNRIACIANGSIGVAFIAIRPGTERRYVSSIAIGAQTDRFRVASDRQQSVIWSRSVAALQNVNWQSVVIRSPPGLIDRC